MNKWDRRFMEMAEYVGKWSSCLREGRQIGAVIVRDKRILTTGYNGAPAGLLSCQEKGYCMRTRDNIPSGTRHELCYAIHAEQNALIQAAKLGVSVQGATLYCTHQPCAICTKLIINAGIARVVYRYPYPDAFALTLWQESGVEVRSFGELEAEEA